MTQKIITVLVLVFVLFSCSGDSESPDGQDNPNDSTDTTVPVISIANLTSILAVTTSIDVTITDASDDVLSRILIDGTEVFRSELKNFSYELDPFDFPNGERTFRVESIDNSGNEAESSTTFELRKLLISSQGLRGDISTADEDIFMAINTLDGELVEYRRIVFPEDGVFFAPDGFERQDFVVTSYEISNGSFITINSYSGVSPDSEILTTEEAIPLFNFSPSESLAGSFSVTVTDVPNNSFLQNLFANGHLYLGSPSGSSIDIFFDSAMEDAIDDAVIFRRGFISPLDISDYRYIALDALENQTVSFNDFLLPDDTFDLELPLDISDLRISINGYKSEADYNSFIFDRIYESNLIASTTTDPMVRIPLINVYPEISQELFFRLDATTTAVASHRGFSRYESPILNVQRSGDEITINGDHDNSTFRFSNGAPNSFLLWDYYHDNAQILRLPFDTFEIPEEILAFFGDLIIPTNSSEGLSLNITIGEETNDYDNSLFYLNFVNNNNVLGNTTILINELN